MNQAKIYRTDLHCHSAASPDGSISEANIKHMLESGKLDVIAITDHNRIDKAQELQSKFQNNFPGAIIVGEEIMTEQGEIIGLFLKASIPSHLPLLTTINLIKIQGGLVYVPHPFERARHGLQAIDLEPVAEFIDLIEVNNGRSFSRRAQRIAQEFATKHDIAIFSSSDAHGRAGWGKVHTELSKLPTVKNLVKLARTGTIITGTSHPAAYVYPKLNRLRKPRTNNKH